MDICAINSSPFSGENAVIFSMI